MTSTLAEQAVVGRRVEIALFRDPTTYLPGIITDVTTDRAALRIRLDGKRHNIACRTDHEFLRYLDDVVTPVPALPMGPFTPTGADMLGVWADVPLSPIGEDGADLVILTDDPAKARAAAAAYDAEIGLDLDCVDYGALSVKWAVFEWEPEDAECPWTVRWAAEGDEHAIRIYYLPA